MDMDIMRTVFLFTLIWLGIADVRTGLLVNRIVLPLGVLGLLWQLFHVCQLDAEWVTVLAGAAAGGGSLWLLRRVTRGGLGGGDVKLGLVMGIWLGCPGIFIALLAAFVLGGFVAAGLLLGRRCTGRDALPFGPFLAAGGWIAVLAGQLLWQAYMTLF